MQLLTFRIVVLSCHEVAKRETCAIRSGRRPPTWFSRQMTPDTTTLNLRSHAFQDKYAYSNLNRCLTCFQQPAIVLKMPKKDTQNKAWAEDKNKFGLKMLEKMGWKGKGLGKNEDGLEQHVKVTKRSANLGLGTEDTGSNNDRIDAFAGQRSWERTNSHFSDVLATLNSANKGVVKKIKKLKKKKNKKDHVEGGVSPRSTAKAVSFRTVIRKKELKGKNVAAFSAEDIALIVGSKRSRPDDGSSSEGSSDGNAKEKKRKKAKKEKKEKKAKKEKKEKTDKKAKKEKKDKKAKKEKKEKKDKKAKKAKKE